MILHIPHSSTLIPKSECKEILLDDDGLNSEILAMTDLYTEDFDLSPVTVPLYRVT
jgi:hypothetical protein